VKFILDSSLWVDLTRAKSSATVKRQIRPWVLRPNCCLCEPVRFEVLRHATRDERRILPRYFENFSILESPSNLWSAATELGQQCRDAGQSPGGLDLLIAAVAIAHTAELVTFDTDFILIAEVSPLRIQLLDRAI
jgi:predicted nucleic acid-binding protein